MPPVAPRTLLAGVAERVTDETGLVASADRAPLNAAVPYVTVRQVSPHAPELSGDNATLAEATLVQASLFETRDGEDPARVAALVTALDGAKIATVTGGYSGRVQAVARLPDPETDVIHHAVTLRYVLPR